MSYSISAVNPAYPNACANETLTGIPAGLTQSQLDSNPIASRFGAELNVDCASRGFSTKGVNMGPKNVHFGSATVAWNGQVWTK